MQQKKFNEVAKEWLIIKKISIKYSTYTKYETIITNHLNKQFNNMNINEISEKIVISYFTDLLNNKVYAISTIKTLRYVLKAILDYAQKKYNFNNNSFQYIKLKKTKPTINILTSKQKKQLEQYCFNHQKNYTLVIILSLYGGFRLGEVAGLKWCDVDFENHCISINRTIERLKTNNSSSKTTLMALEPKTHTSKRIVPMPEFIIDFLIKYYKKQSNPKKQSYIYTNSIKIPDPRNIQYHFHKICNTLEFKCNYHTLRHTYATNCVMNDIDIKSLSEMLGHSNVSITLELYVHSSLEFKKSQINKLKTPSYVAELYFPRQKWAITNKDF